MKKVIALLLAVMVLTLTASALAETPVVEKVEYEGNGFVEVDFLRDVEYQNLTVTVKDFLGAEYAVTIFERDDDDLAFRAEGLQPGETYEVTIAGVRSGRSGEYETISQQISVPEAGVPAIKSVEYEDGELEIDFVEAVSFQDVQLEVTDLNGTVYESKITETDRDSLEARVSGLVWGETYLVNVRGVSVRGLDSYMTAAMEFIARDD